MDNPPILPILPEPPTQQQLNPPPVVERVAVPPAVKFGHTLLISKSHANAATVPHVIPDPKLLPPVDFNPTFSGTPTIDLTPTQWENFKHLVKSLVGQPIEKMGRDMRNSAVGLILGFTQDGYLFCPSGDGVKPMKQPEEYTILRRCAERTGNPVTERVLITEHNAEGNATATIKLWEHKASSADKPHVFFFTGRTGHVADAGDFPKGIGMNDPRVKGYKREAGIEFLAALADKGYGFTAVTLRGYGGNLGKPGDKNFTQDIRILVDDLVSKKQMPDSVIVAGYSMGTANAAKMAVEMTRKAHSKRCEPPAMLALANGFSSMIDRATQFVKEYVNAINNETIRGWLKDVEVDRKRMKDDILNHPFDTEGEISRLTPATKVVTAFSTLDNVNDPSNSIRIDEVARKCGLPHHIQAFEGCGHINMPPEKLADYIDQEWREIGRQRDRGTRTRLPQRMQSGSFTASVAGVASNNGHSI